MDVLESNEKRISLKFSGIPVQYTNALRRICLNGIPVFAIDTVEVLENSSVLADEGLAHRLGLIPLKTDLAELGDFSSIDVNDPSNRVLLTLDSGDSKETRTVFSGELASQDPLVSPISGDVPIVELAPGQRVKIEAYARLGRGTEHAKWNASNISVLVDSEDGEKILTVETAGAVAPEQIVMAGVFELYNRLAEFREIMDRLKLEKTEAAASS